jgi:DHA3 family tetracycline resistance protein-like MFS transporter
VGGLVGILVSTALGSIQINAPIVVGGGLYVLLAGFLALAMPETAFHPTPREERSSWQQMGHTLKSGLGLVRQRPALLSLLGIGLFFGLYSEGFDRLWTPHLLQNFTFPALGGINTVAWFGIMGVVSRLITLGGVELIRRRWDPDDPRRAVIALFGSSLALVAALLTFAASRSFTLALAAYWTIAFTRSLNDPYLTAWINRHLESSVRATVISMSSQIDALGQIVAGPILGAVGTLFSVRAAIFTSGLVLAPVLILLARAIPRETAPTSLSSRGTPDA